MSANLIDARLIADAAHNLQPDSGASDAYAQGVLLGLVTGLMACTDKSFDDALTFVVKTLRKPVPLSRVPMPWQEIYRYIVEVRSITEGATS